MEFPRAFSWFHEWNFLLIFLFLSTYNLSYNETPIELHQLKVHQYNLSLGASFLMKCLADCYIITYDNRICFKFIRGIVLNLISIDCFYYNMSKFIALYTMESMLYKQMPNSKISNFKLYLCVTQTRGVLILWLWMRQNIYTND